MRLGCLWLDIITYTLMVSRNTARAGQWQGLLSMWVTVGFDCSRGEGNQGERRAECRSVSQTTSGQITRFWIRGPGLGCGWYWCSNSALLEHQCHHGGTELRQEFASCYIKIMKYLIWCFMYRLFFDTMHECKWCDSCFLSTRVPQCWKKSAHALEFFALHCFQMDNSFS